MRKMEFSRIPLGIIWYLSQKFHSKYSKEKWVDCNKSYSQTRIEGQVNVANNNFNEAEHIDNQERTSVGT